jgi:hypothetical protein
VSAVLVVAGLAAVFGVSTVSHPATVGSSTQLAQPTRAVVSSAARACPAPGSAGATAASVATAAIPGAASTGAATASHAVITRLSAADAAARRVVRTLTKPNVLGWSPVSPAPLPRKPQKKKTAGSGAANGGSGGGNGSAGNGSAGNGKAGNGKAGNGSAGGAVTTSAGRGGVEVQATGALAQGLEVEQTAPGGLVSAQCPAPGTDFWFVGPGVSAAAQIQLYLMNTDDQQADVQVDVLTDSGPLLESSDTGIVVPPHGMVVQSLGKLLRSSRVIALHVSTSIGRVAAALRETKSLSSQGGWLPAAQAPSKRLVIPGLPASAGSRNLYILVPGTGNAKVKVTAVTSKGSYQPTGGNGIELAGDSAVGIQLPSLSNVAAAIKITSNVPVTAAIMVPGGAAGAPGAFTAAAGPISQQGVAAANPTGSAGFANLVISAPRTAVSVRIVEATSKIAATGQAGTVVHVGAGRSAVTRVKPPKGGKTADFAVVITPLSGSGPVYVGRVISSGGVIRSILPVTSALQWVPLPPAEDSLDASSSGH